MSSQATIRCVTRMALAIALAVGLVLPAPVTAQEVGEGGEDGQAGEIRRTGQTLVLPDGVASRTELTLWSVGRRGYRLTGTNNSFFNIALTGGRIGIASFDLDTLEDVAAATAEDLPDLYPANHGQLIAVDSARGRLFVPHFHASDEPAANAALCQPDPAVPPCMAGLYVLDAETLEEVEDIPFRRVAVPDTPVQMAPIHVAYAPARSSADEDKVYVLAYEQAGSVMGLAGSSSDPKSRTTFHYAIQIDAATLEVDWVARVDACTGRVGEGGSFEPYRGVIFRSSDEPAVLAGCRGSGVNNGWVTRLDLDPEDPDAGVVAQQRFPGPPGVSTFRADPSGERLFLKSNHNREESWWVFDGDTRTYLKKLGVGEYPAGRTAVGLDPSTGRMYVLAPPREGSTSSAAGGLFVADSRRRDIPQFVQLPAFADLGSTVGGGTPIAVDPEVAGEGPRRLFVPQVDDDGDVDRFTILEDTTPVSEDSPPAAPDADRTVDVPEVEGHTLAQFRGQARGYGFRTILVGGIDAVHNNLLIDHDSYLKRGLAIDEVFIPGQDGPTKLPRYNNPCTDQSRQFIFGLAGSDAADLPPRIDHLGGASAQAYALFADAQTQDDMAAAVTRCGSSLAPSWEELMDTLAVRDVEEPAVRGHFENSSCAAPDRPSGARGDPVLTGARSEVDCVGGEEVRGESYVSASGINEVAITEARATFSSRREADGGVSARTESWVRGVSLTTDTGAIFIDSVRAVAEAWSTGRSRSSGRDDDSASGCDRSSTVGTCYTRSITGVEVVDANGDVLFRCDACNDDGNQRQMVAAMQAALGSSWVVRLRSPDEELAEGSEDGFQAAIQKRDIERFSDAALSHDLLPTLPALELIRISNGAVTPGRQIYQFAGTEVGTTYGITCLLVMQDGECTAEAASLRIELEDTDGQALSGGVFEVQADADGDGTISLEESTTPARTCVTAADGSCELDPIAAGSYVVHQALAPAGFAPAPDTPVVLPAGGQGLIEVVNGRLATTGLRINLTDTADPPQPLAGGTFEVHADDGDGALGSGDVLLATCTTGATGACPFELAVADSVLTGTSIAAGDPRLLLVPAGPYVVHQSAAPDGYAPIDDVAFTLPEGQIADANFQNGRRSEQATPTESTAEPTETSSSEAVGDVPPEQPPPAVDAPVQEPVAIAPPAPAPPPVVTVNVPEVPAQAPAVAPPAAQPSTMVRVLQAPVAAARLLLRSPLEAAAFGGVLLLFAAAGAGAWRRRLLLDLLSD